MSELMKIRELQAKVVNEMFLSVDQGQVDALVDAIMEADRIFVSGWGRAGNVGRIMGMNCSQLGRVVFCVGDNNTPAITDKDLLIITSGSGNTKAITILCGQAKEHGAKVALVSSNAESTMGKMADINVEIKRPELPDGQEPSQREKRALGDSFYEAAFMLNDFVRSCIMERTGQTTDDIHYYHNNLE